VPVRILQFTAADLSSPQGIQKLNQYITELVNEINRLGGQNGPIQLNAALDMQGNAVTNIGAPTSKADALNQTNADPMYSQPVMQNAMEALGTKMLQSSRRLNDQNQQEKNSSYLNSLGAEPQNSNGSQISATAGNPATVSVTAAISNTADGGKVSYISRSDTITFTGNGLPGNSAIFYYLRKLDNTLQVTQLFSDANGLANSAANRMTANLDGRQFVAVAVGDSVGGFNAASSGAGFDTTPAKGCTEIGTHLEFPQGSNVSRRIEPCEDWIAIETESGLVVNVAVGTLVSVFMRAQELVTGDMVEGKNGAIEVVKSTREFRRKSHKQKLVVEPGHTYLGNGIRLHNAKVGCG